MEQELRASAARREEGAHAGAAARLGSSAGGVGRRDVGQGGAEANLFALFFFVVDSVSMRNTPSSWSLPLFIWSTKFIASSIIRLT